MPDITTQTPAEVMTSVRSHRAGYETTKLEQALPNDSDVVEKSFKHTVTAAEDTAGQVDIDTGLASLQRISVDIYASGGAIKTNDQVVTQPSVGVVRVADGTTVLAAGDVIHLSVRGVK